MDLSLAYAIWLALQLFQRMMKMPWEMLGQLRPAQLKVFLIYVSLLTATSYYALGFSTYSYVGVLNNFDRGKIYWIEKWIHSLVHLFPVVLGLSLLGLGAINNGGHGYCIPVISSPLGCNDPDIGVECERGPKRQQEYRAMQLFWIIPYSLLIIFPAIIMFILYLTVKKQQTDIHIKANVLLLQAFLFLIGEYFLIVPLLTHNVIVIAGAKPNSTSALFVYIGYFFFNCWTLFAYLYFSRYGSESKEGESTQQSSEYSFNIFDGTNAAGEFAQYVHGASNDEVEDDMQDHKEWEEAQPQT
mmetsp:Transcript_20047/g.30149  ORF Transcript_20047/g.30149 Transcript_20047/m.30149 type:complete len:300 (-) Transcript_20047:101-1000(-)